MVYPMKNISDETIQTKVFLANCQEIIQSLQAMRYDKFYFITDPNIHCLYWEAFDNISNKSFYIAHSKTLEEFEKIQSSMILEGCTRNSCVVGLGGGTVGDIAGFVASTFMRGVDLIMVPTSLLAMVDSSIGGKNGIDSCMGKNLIGSFHLPSYIFIDASFLQTMEKQQLVNGFAEIIKIGIISNRRLFEMVEQNSDRFMQLEGIEELIEMSAKEKLKITSEDHKDRGNRTFLNFGHTIGHAVETLTKIDHGHAVSIGIVFESMLSTLSSIERFRIKRCLESFGLPVDSNYSSDDLLKLMARDKKNLREEIRIVCPSKIGNISSVAISSFSKEEISSVLNIRNSFSSGNFLRKPPINIRIPSSKSILNRVLIICALSGTTVSLENVSFADDTLTMMHCLSKCGLEYEYDGKTLNLKGSKLSLPASLYVGDSGTVSRFLLALCAVVGGECAISGGNQIQSRPILPLIKCLRQQGCIISNDCLPLTIKSKGLTGGTMSIDASVSSQFLSALLLVSTYKSIGFNVEVEGNLVSPAFVDMTISILNEFGMNFDVEDFKFKPKSTFKHIETYKVEPDASAMAFVASFAAITGNTVRLETTSIQNDIEYIDILIEMGCKLKKCEGYFELTGPCKLKSLGNVDFGPMTDCFLVFAILACLADGKTVISGISNQRLKECNRILAMVYNLARLGFDVQETSDGLIVNGIGHNIGDRLCLPSLQIECFADHRVSMSFGILSCILTNPLTLDTTCVAKTWPGFWEEFRPFQHVDGGKDYQSNSIFLIGMRGVGKTTLGKLLASELGYQFVDLDNLFESVYNIHPSEFISRNGWSEFREKEFKILAKCLSEDTVYSTGGGVVESEKSRLFLKNQKFVLYLKNMKLSRRDNDQSVYEEGFHAVLERRIPLYASSCRYECDITGLEIMDASKRLFSLSRRMINSKSEQQIPSFFFSLPKEAWSDVSANFDGCVCVEFRADLCPEVDMSDALHHPKMKNKILIYTLRSIEEGGHFSGDPWPYLEKASRIGFDIIDIEYDKIQKASQLDRINSRIIISCHKVGVPTVNDFMKCKTLNPDFIKVVGTASCFDDNFKLKKVVDSLDFDVISFLMGDSGRMSRAMNKYMTPVCHSGYSPVAAGQMSLNDIVKLQTSMGIIVPKKFYLFGSPISKSPSQIYHEKGFKYYGLPYTYEKIETIDPLVLEAKVREYDFGGASVTIPLKEKLKFLPLNEESEKIGAGNTIYFESGKLSVSNTDWVAIYHFLQTIPKCGNALVIGAGGTAKAAIYALKQHNLNVFVWSRTSEKARALSNDCSVNHIDILEGEFDCIVSCIPPSTVSIPDSLFKSCKLFIDVAYAVEGTEAVRRAQEINIKVVDGFQVFRQQANAQFYLWTGLEYPSSLTWDNITERVNGDCD